MAECKPITLGYAAIVGEKTVTYTGHKVGSIYGLLHGITHSGAASGPGGNSAMYYDPKTGLVATLGRRIIQKMWDLEGLEDMSVRGMGQSAHPVPSTANFITQALFLDKYYAATCSVPRVPRVAFRSIRDVLTGAGERMIKKWARDVEGWTRAKRGNPERRNPAVRPLILGDEVTKFWARGWVFDLRGCERGEAPVRLERRGRSKHAMRLSNLPHMEDYNDPDVFIMDLTGFSTGSNPGRQVVLHCNTENFVEQEEHAIDGIEEEIGRGWLGVTEFIPFYPFQASNFFMIKQKEKWRRIYNLSKEARGRSVNQQRTAFVKAKLELVQHIWFRRQLHRAAVLVLRMRSWGWAVKVELFVVDLFKAYNQMCNDERELWFNGCHYVDRGGRLRFMTGERTGFGGENAPHGFGAKVTRAANHSVDGALDRAGDGYELQAAYRRELARRKGEAFEAPAVTVRENRGCCVLRGRDILGAEAEEEKGVLEALEKDEGASITDEWYWGQLKRGQDLVSETPLMAPGPSVSKDRDDKTYCCGTYLDDAFGLLVLFEEKSGSRRPHKGEDYITNKSEALVKYRARAEPARRGEVEAAIARATAREAKKEVGTGTQGVQRGEELRQRYVRETLEAGGLKVVCDPKSQKKYDGGACAEVQEILGLVYDTTDPTNPLTGLPTGKQEELRGRLRALEGEQGDELEHEEVESLAHKLSAAALATARGRIYLGGFFEALRRRRRGGGTKIFYTKWLRRNVKWWLAYFESGAPRMRILVPTPDLEQKYCPHTDASTKWGFGGHWIKETPTGSVCYYIQGEWSASEKRLIEQHKGVGIAFLEMAAVDFLLGTAAEIGLQGKSFDFYCDNQNAIKILTSYKSRTLPLSLLLESIDRHIEVGEYSTAFAYISTLLNVGSDALSRGCLAEFKEYITRAYGVTSFVHLQVPANVRNIEGSVKLFMEHPEWIVLDGETGSSA